MADGSHRPGWRAWLLRAAVGAMVVAFVTATAVWWAALPQVPDDFYRTAVPLSARPGTLLRSEPFSRAMPEGARAWRIAYATTRWNDSPALASAVVVAAATAPSGPRPVIAWAHGTTGVAQGCALSLMRKPLANVPAVDSILREGWVFVATDYAGLGTGGGHGYLIGEDAARSVLDAVRAARQLQDLTLGDRVVVWGHSQGGNSALWTGMRAPTYAPDVDVVGIAALAPASDLIRLLSDRTKSPFGKITMSYMIRAYGASYPDVRIEDYVGPAMRLAAADLAARCVGDWPTLVSMVQAKLLPGDSIFSREPTTGALGARLGQNTPGQLIAAPVLIAQGDADDLIPKAAQDGYVAARCAASQPIDYRIYPGLDHLSLVAPRSALDPDLVAWSRDRLSGRASANTCKW